MAKQYDKTNSWNLFKVEEEERKSDSYPNYSGYINVDGTDYLLTGWLREGQKSGRKFIGGTIKLKEDAKAAANVEQADNKEEIPF